MDPSPKRRTMAQQARDALDASTSKRTGSPASGLALSTFTVIVTPDATAVHDVRPDEKGISTTMGGAAVVTRTDVDVDPGGPVVAVVDGTAVVDA